MVSGIEERGRGVDSIGSMLSSMFYFVFFISTFVKILYRRLSRFIVWNNGDECIDKELGTLADMILEVMFYYSGRVIVADCLDGETSEKPRRVASGHYLRKV